MRISDLATAADTTVRTIRHYHRLGLLPEPPRSSNGYRVYSLEDLVRLTRIRWLARSGVPLGAIPTVLGTATDARSQDDLEADLQALISDVDAQLHTLQGRRHALAAMLDGHRRGDTLSPLPGPMAQAFAELINGEDDPRTRELFVRERDSWELVVLSGQTPREFLDAATAALTDPDRRPAVIALYRRFGALAGHDPETVADEIAAVANGLAEFLTTFTAGAGGGLFTDWTESAAAVAASDESLMAEVLPDPAQRKVAVGVIARVADAAGASR